MSASMEARIAEHATAPTPQLPVAPSPVPLPSPLTTSPTNAGAPLGYRAAGIRIRAAVASPPSLLPPTSPKTDVPEAEMPPLEESLSYYSHSWIRRSGEFIGRQRTEEFEIRFEEAHDDRAYLGALVNTLYRDRPHHRRTTLAMDREAVYARIA
ncbi:hypothetical protein Tco_0564293 [Tanacetum coccineum]